MELNFRDLQWTG